VSAEDLLLIGKITKPHGVRGKLKAISYAESPLVFSDADVLYLSLKSGPQISLKVESVSFHGDTAILELEEIKSREKAEEIAGGELYIEKKYLTPLEEDEYYRYELIGLEVETVGGLNIGTIEDVFPTGANDVLVVRKGKVENLIPTTQEVIKEVDLELKRVIIEPLENMIEGL